MFAAATGAAPAAVTISTSATQNMTCSGGTCTPTAANAVLSVGDLQTMLASSNVTVNTGTGSLPAQVEDIFVTASFNWASANSLTLDAYRSVTVSAPIAVNGSAPVSLVTNDGGSGGTLSFISGGSVAFLGTGNSLSINAKAYSLENSIAALAAAIAHKSSGYYALSASYDASHDGKYNKSPIPTKFKGTFNGLGNTISNLSIQSKDDDVGLFADVEAHGEVNSLNATGANIDARGNNEKTGVLIGTVAAINDGTIFNTFAGAQIKVSSGKYGTLVGGLVGGNAGIILQSAAAANIAATRQKSPNNAVEAGGLSGSNDGTIEVSYATGTTTVAGETTGAFSGGLVGLNEGLIEDCYAQGAATAPSSSDVGGLVGNTSSAITDAYSTGATTTGDDGSVGGFAGVDGSRGGLSSNYWDTTTSGITNLSQGAGNIANDPGITGETTAQLQSGLPAGFDPTIWAENPSINGGLPYLINNPPQ
jgi:hypothetical protein